MGPYINLTLSSGNLPVCEGTINGKKGTILRDTGTTHVICKRNFIRDDQLDGVEYNCKLADGTTVKAKTARIGIDSYYLKGQVNVLVLEDCPFDCLIGNIAEAKDPVLNQTSCVVETRSKTKIEKINPLPADEV